ncbi:MAG: hypothetical protein JNL34_01585 [Anaerolineae bacterium]|nr:hypothetical protein [Anaerolineae bacterium]
MRRLYAVTATAIVIAVGLMTLVGLLTGFFGGLSSLALQIALVTTGLTLLIGVLNLLNVHIRRVLGRQRGALYSLVLLISFLLVIALWLLGEDDANRALVQDAQRSVEAALAALLVFALVYGAYRLMRQRVTWAAVLFTAALLIVLVGALPFEGLGILAGVRDWMLQVPASAGARGLLIGIALGVIVTAVRVIIGQDRAYRE